MTASQERRVCNNSLIQRFLLPPFFEMFESKGGGNSMSPRKTGNCIKYNNQRDAGEWEQEGLRLQGAKNHKAERVSCSYFELWCLFANPVNKEEAESPGSASTENCRQRSEKHEKLWQANNLKANVVSFLPHITQQWKEGCWRRLQCGQNQKTLCQWKKSNIKVFNMHIKYYIKFST